ncbi:hypothetical protein UMM65_14235 [Aureibaculum sp. 2210JD6-5]|uniref:hypothetical protein n=1 Tax=Aureibaculum sp. 2210JD6-5 TaxID=3103957 RepID=UPI002AAEB7FF|nr:hypothetical protein [Aureibaculum sp. 2210JD6-5]MDY7396406.1 hypothetical protein [Aureibaculum sp. 2210JD6-5]
MSDTTISLIKNSIRYFELISAIAGTVYFYKYKHTDLKYFLYLLWYITITEFLGWYIWLTGNMAHIDENGWIYNLWLYNILNLVMFNTVYFIYYNYLKTQLFKKWTKLFIIIFTIVYALNWIFIQNFITENAVLPRIIGSIFLIITIIFFFIELLRSEKIVVFHKLLLFWISVGLLLFYTGTIPFMLKWNGYMLIPGIHELFLIVYILAIIMYSIFTFGFIWSKKE